MINRKYTSIVCLALIAVFFLQCKTKKEEGAIPESSFDKTGMLGNLGGNIILPAYSDLKISMDSLLNCCNLFTANPTLTTLGNLQSQFLRSYSSYQRVSSFEFGPADTELIRANFNTFPCDTLQINSKIIAGNLSLSTVADLDAKGLPALDFLLYGSTQNNNAILTEFTSSASATNRKNYLTALITELKTKTDAVNIGWSPSGGNYLSTFRSSTGSDVGSSIGMLINQLNFDFELLKNAKVGIPLGKKTLGTALPDKVEAFYSQQSLALITEHLQSIENIYLGRNTQNSDGLGLDDYLVHVKAQHTSGSLNDAIKNKFTSAKAKLVAISGTLSDAVIANPTIVDAAYAELQQLIVLLKVDMPSALGVLITYQDNDGD